MFAKAESGIPRAVARLLAALLVWIALALPAGAQPNDRSNVWDATATRIEERVNDASTPTPVLEALRAELVRIRDEALAVQKEQEPAISDLNGRLKALGEPPAEGTTEAPEIAQRRQTLNQQLADAQAPVLEAQEVLERVNGLIEQTDRIVRARFSAELLSRGPTPLLPSTWLAAGEEAWTRLLAAKERVVSELSDATNRRVAARRLPGNLALLVIGVAMAVMLRRAVGHWIERRAAAAPRGSRTFDLLLALRNLLRLVVPVVAIGLIFAAFDLGVLFAGEPSASFFELPLPVGLLIAAFWLSSSLFAPALPEYRLVPFDDHEADHASRLTIFLGTLLALAAAVKGAAPQWDVSQGTQVAVFYPLLVLGAIGLWRAGRFISRLLRHLGPHDASEAPALATGLGFLSVVARVIRVFAILAPILGAAGYMAAGAFLVYPSILTLGLIGAGYVIYDLLCKMIWATIGPPGEGQDAGLLPVVIGGMVCLAAIPWLALTWGARWSDLAEVWALLNNGVTMGGIRLSAGVILTLVAVFALGAALTRLLQRVMRSTVLPRTRLDAGGRNAVLAGIGYVGFAFAGLAAISAAGLDLSSLAIVAGALSVGIGFGMQNIVSNFVSGIILLVERPVKEGDWIEVGGYSGYVRGINVRSTEVETFDRASVILPNSSLIAGAVLNRTHKSMAGRLQVPISVAYDSDPKIVERILLEIAETHPLVLEEPSPRVLFMSFGADSMDFELRCWLRDVNFQLSAKSDMNFEIFEAFRKAGIRINAYGRDLPAAHPVPEHLEQPTAGASSDVSAPPQSSIADAGENTKVIVEK
jgi:small-conductance mechanosensitive channel